MDSKRGRLVDDGQVAALASIFCDEKYLLWPKISRCQSVGSFLGIMAGWWYTSRQAYPEVLVCVKEGATARDLVKAWYHALLLVVGLNDEVVASGTENTVVMIQLALRQVEERWGDLLKRLEESGWDLEVGGFETRERLRIRVEDVGDVEGRRGPKEETGGLEREKKNV